MIVNDRYELLSVLNRGSFGIVRLVRDINTDTIYAAKFIRSRPSHHKRAKSTDADDASSEGSCYTRDRSQSYLESDHSRQSQCYSQHQSQRTHQSVDCDNSERNSYQQNDTTAKTYLSNLDEAEHEILIHEILGDHPFIASLVDHFETPDGFYLILEYCSGGDLYELINKDDILPTSRVRDIMLQLIEALQYCHSKGVYHRDIKPENILLAADGTIRLADWGLASTTRMCTDFGVGSKQYMAPECFDERSKSYDAAQADIWALGICLLNALFARNPFKIATQKDRLFTDFATDRENLFDVFPALSREVFRALRHALTIDPENRSLELFNAALLEVRLWTTDDEYDLLDEEEEVDTPNEVEYPSTQTREIPISATTDERPPLRVPTAVAMSLSPVTIWDRRDQFTPPSNRLKQRHGFGLGNVIEVDSEEDDDQEFSSSQRDGRSVNSSQLSDTELFGDDHDIFDMDGMDEKLSRCHIDTKNAPAEKRSAFAHHRLSANKQQTHLHGLAASPPSMTTDTQSEDSKEFMIPSMTRRLPFEFPEKDTAVLSWADDEEGLDEIFLKHRAVRT